MAERTYNVPMNREQVLAYLANIEFDEGDSLDRVLGEVAKYTPGQVIGCRMTGLHGEIVDYGVFGFPEYIAPEGAPKYEIGYEVEFGDGDFELLFEPNAEAPFSK